tara:strand:+ start:11 stop:391 length:381 start_codon:yes stop_codon:yes gene_type:complete
MYRYILAAILASIVGLIGGIQGNAGTVYLLAGLLFLNIVKTQQQAAAITLLYTSVPLTLGAAWEFHKRGKLDYKIAAICIIFGFIFSILGARLNFFISEKNVVLSTALLMFISSGIFFVRYLKLLK